MIELYNYITSGSITDIERIFMIVIFMMVFDSIMNIAVELIRMGSGRR